ncbi:hypothetical protein Taro_054231 [Colocasia esculenta]|uniref:Uncharacterized protein n=1 Tax=Colocasia esculenta TaxID=4460 RepID=A0A843XQK7_COLES|nr:hypothetical protein [Colocasia esculenta]
MVAPFLAGLRSGTRLLDFWGAVVGAGNVVKIPPEKVVLPPTFSPAPSVTISSTAELPSASPPEEGKIPRRTSGESNDTVRLIAELVAVSPAIASPPSTTVAAGMETTSRDAAVASSSSGASEPLSGRSADASAEECLCLPEAPSLETTTGEAGGAASPGEGNRSVPTPSGAQGGDLLQPPSSEVLFGEPSTFPDHSVSWPGAPQGTQMPETDGMLESFMRFARAVMEESSPPSVEAVRDVLQRSTLAYHLMGCPRDPWVAAVDSLWGEMKQLHQEAALAANRLKIQELGGEISLLREEAGALDLQMTASRERAQTLRARRAGFCDEVAKLRKTANEIQRRIATCELSIATLD